MKNHTFLTTSSPTFTAGEDRGRAFTATEDSGATSTAGEDSGVMEWIVDSGAAHHMVNGKCGRRCTQPWTRGNVFTANGGEMKVIGKHTERAFTWVKGEKVRLDIESAVIPDLKANLLAVRPLVKKGYEVLFSGEECFIMEDGVTVAKAVDDGHNYVLLTFKEGTALAVSSEEWHRRFSHLCPQLMAKMKDKVGNVAMKQCEVCVLGKIRRSPFPARSSGAGAGAQ